MSIKGLVFIILFFCCVAGALVAPHLGIYGYIFDYCISPKNQWWGGVFYRMGIRFSFYIAIATLIGMYLQRKKLEFGNKQFYFQEKLLIFLTFLIWISYYLGPETVGRYANVDHPAIKFIKVAIFLLMMTHLITNLKKLNGLFFVLSTTTLMLGFKAWSVPYGAFVSGRLERIGGPDFAEANFLAAFMAAMLPIIGVQFLKSKIWHLKVYYFICGAFAANTLSLCRSRGSFVGLAVGAIAACFFAPKRIRGRIIVLMFIGLLGLVYVSDEYFVERILSISLEHSEMDASSAKRIDFWKAGLKIIKDNPLGIGPGNWFQKIGLYLPESEGRDTHNTYIRCAAEQGLLGIFLFLWILWQAYRNLISVYNDSHDLLSGNADEYNYYFFSIFVSLVIILTCGITITMIYTEFFWIFLMLPVCLKRIFDNDELSNSSRFLQPDADKNNKLF